MNDLTQQGVVALKSGNKIRARNLLKAALRQDPGNVDAWLWLSGAVDTDAERLDCLQNVLRLDPSNRAAAKGYAALTGNEWAPPSTTTVVPPPAAIPMSEGAPPAALEQFEAAVDNMPAAVPEEAEVDLGILQEFPTTTDEAAESEAAGQEAAAGEAAEMPGEQPEAFETGMVEEAEILEPVVEEPAEEEPRIKSWEELLGPAEEDEPPAAVEVFGQEEEVSDTQEVRIGKPGSSLKFVTGPSLGYGLLKLLLLLAVLAAIVAAVYYNVPSVPAIYVLGAATVLAIIWLFLLLVLLIGSSASRYTLTKEKLLVESGMFGKKQVSLAVGDIQDVQPSRGLLQSMAGVGNILVRAKTEGQDLLLKDVAHFKQRLQELEDAIL